MLFIFFLLAAGAPFAQGMAAHEEALSLSEADRQSVDRIFVAQINPVRLDVHWA